MFSPPSMTFERTHRAPIALSWTTGAQTSRCARPRRAASGRERLHHPVNLGYGSAIQTAAKYALAGEYEAIVFFDGDGQHSGSDVPAALAIIAEEEANVAVGSRFLGSCGYAIPLSRRVGMVVFRTVLRAFSGLRVTDPTSGLQALDRRAMRICASDSFNTAFPDADMLLLYHRAGLKGRRVPRDFQASDVGKLDALVSSPQLTMSTR